jgi:hypothetical protein
MAVDPSSCAAVAEESLGVPSRHHGVRQAQRLDQCLAGARLGSSEESLDLRERLLDRVEVRRAGRQEAPTCQGDIYRNAAGATC